MTAAEILPVVFKMVNSRQSGPIRYQFFSQYNSVYIISTISSPFRNKRFMLDEIFAIFLE